MDIIIPPQMVQDACSFGGVHGVYQLEVSAPRTDVEHCQRINVPPRCPIGYASHACRCDPP